MGLFFNILYIIMSADKTIKSPHRVKIFVYVAMVAIVYWFLTLVVIMLVTGTIHIIDRKFFSLPLPGIFSGTAACIILAVSLIVFVKNYRKIYDQVKKMAGPYTSGGE